MWETSEQFSITTRRLIDFLYNSHLSVILNGVVVQSRDVTEHFARNEHLTSSV